MSIEALRVFEVAADGMSAQRVKIDTVSENIANAETTRTPEGGPYRRKTVTMSAPNARADFRRELQSAQIKLRRTRDGHGMALPVSRAQSLRATTAVKATTGEEPPDQVKLIFDPTHPDADENGYVAMPDVELITEMVDLMTATRAYEANITSIEATKQMVDKALEI